MRRTHGGHICAELAVLYIKAASTAKIAACQSKQHSPARQGNCRPGCCRPADSKPAGQKYRFNITPPASPPAPARGCTADDHLCESCAVRRPRQGFANAKSPVIADWALNAWLPEQGSNLRPAD
jgi:hypothetical protein